MKEIQISTSLQVFNSIDELRPMDCELLQLAHAACDTAYAPYSNFRVGAAVLLANGKMIPGSNQENASYPLCLCAERTALAAAASQYPNVPVLACAVTARSANKSIDRPISPCGACRQVLVETELKYEQNMLIIMQGETGEIYIMKSGKDLLPLSFEGKFL